MSEIQYAGEFKLEECTLCTVGGLELDLTKLVATINIYEDIFSTSISGTISFQDTNNLLGNKDISIIGQEKLKLKLSTPNADDTGDRNRVINYTETPLYVYKIDDKVSVNENTDAFMLHFTTPEFIRNNHVRVVKSYEGEPSEDIIQNILPVYIQSFIELDINEDTIIQSQNCLKKICCMIINKNMNSNDIKK